MKATATIVDPEKVQLTIALTMTVGQWKELMAKLPSEYPAWKFSALVREVLGKSLGQVQQSHQAEQ